MEYILLNWMNQLKSFNSSKITNIYNYFVPKNTVSNIKILFSNQNKLKECLNLKMPLKVFPFGWVWQFPWDLSIKARILLIDWLLLFGPIK